MEDITKNLYENKTQVISTETIFCPEKMTLLLNTQNNAPDLSLKQAKAEQLGLFQKKEWWKWSNSPWRILIN